MAMDIVSMEPGARLRWFGNTLVSIQVGSGEGQDRISVAEHWMPFGDSPPMHVHRNEDEIFHVLEGRMRFRVDDKDIVAEAGETALAPKGIPHSYRAEGEQGTRCLTITHGNDFESMLLECSRLAESRSLPPPSEPTQAMIDQLARCCARNGIDLVGPPL